MNCPHCNSPNTPTARYCTNCGKALAGKVSATTTELRSSRYTIQQRLGKGGMGALYLASEKIAGQQRVVVLKELLAYYDANDQQSVARAHARFEAEARTLASLNMAGIPVIFDYFSENNRNFIVMQYIDGKNLEAGLTHEDDEDNLVEGKAYPIEQVRSWGVKLCKILDYLASKNVVHMDIKPANLILDSSGDIWLVDFGTARADIYGPPPSGAPKPSIYGTPGYAPKEQYAGKPEARSDVYALAATLYHLMTNDDPRDQASPFPWLPRLPQQVAKALQLALNPDVKQRITAAEFGRMLQARPAAGLPFTWRDGAISYEPQDLVLTADRKWAEALDYFKGEDWEKWFRDLYRNNLIAQLQAIRSNSQQSDLALDAFLRVLDPNYPLPKMSLPVPVLNMGMVPWRSLRQVEVLIVNAGSGCLKASFQELPTGVSVEPIEFYTHDQQTVKICLNTSELQPSPRRQQINLEIDAGVGGQVQLPIMVRVPEPNLRLSNEELDFGVTHRGEQQTYKFDISNQGGSVFEGEARTGASWFSVSPVSFQVAPGKRSELEIKVDTSGLSLREHNSQLVIYARAGKWEKIEPISVSIRVSILRTLTHFWLPPTIGMLLGAAYGAVLGGLVGNLVNRVPGLRISGEFIAIFCGAILTALLYILPTTMIGLFGGFSGVRGIKAVRLGALLGGIPGALLGSLAGWLAYRMQTWLFENALVISKSSLSTFGWLVGLQAGALLGLVLYLATRQDSS